MRWVPTLAEISSFASDGMSRLRLIGQTQFAMQSAACGDGSSR